VPVSRTDTPIGYTVFSLVINSTKTGAAEIATG